MTSTTRTSTNKVLGATTNGKYVVLSGRNMRRVLLTKNLIKAIDEYNRIGGYKL